VRGLLRNSFARVIAGLRWLWFGNPPARNAAARKAADDDSEVIAPRLWILPALGLLLAAAYGAANRSWSITAMAAIMVCAGFLVGALVGFLFGIPRTLTADTTPADGAGTVAQPLNYHPNTNLEQISDWLTKILVGVGLVQFGAMRDSARDLIEFLRPGLGNDDVADVFALCALAYAATAGFLASYLVTRLVLQRELATAEGRVVHLVRREFARLDDVGAEALAAVTAQLAGDEPAMSQRELDALVEAAPSSAKIAIFKEAQKQRRENWANDKSAVERTIPVFRALVASDPEKSFHRNRGELGYALKDKPSPDWAAAEAALTDAIAIRDRPRKGRGSRMYEYNRALCRINLDPDFGADRPSSENVKAEIVADLKEAATASYAGSKLKTDRTVIKWAALNGVDLSAL
jgi:hypothetical protein